MVLAEQGEHQQQDGSDEPQSDQNRARLSALFPRTRPVRTRRLMISRRRKRQLRFLGRHRRGRGGRLATAAGTYGGVGAINRRLSVPLDGRIDGLLTWRRSFSLGGLERVAQLLEGLGRHGRCGHGCRGCRSCPPWRWAGGASQLEGCAQGDDYEYSESHVAPDCKLIARRLQAHPLRTSHEGHVARRMCTRCRTPRVTPRRRRTL